MANKQKHKQNVIITFMDNNSSIVHNTHNSTAAYSHVRQFHWQFNPLQTFWFLSSYAGSIENILDTVRGFSYANCHA